MAQGVCEICLSEGVTQEHHIISRAIIGRIKTGEHGSDLDLMNNPRNLMTLCVPCHELTGSHFIRRWIRSQERKGEPIEDEKERRKRYEMNRMRKRIAKEKKVASGEIILCSGIGVWGKGCGNKVEKEGGFCYTHRWQAPKPEE
jgi:hypothetical protein